MISSPVTHTAVLVFSMLPAMLCRALFPAISLLGLCLPTTTSTSFWRTMRFPEQSQSLWSHFSNSISTWSTTKSQVSLRCSAIIMIGMLRVLLLQYFQMFHAHKICRTRQDGWGCPFICRLPCHALSCRLLQ